MFSGSFSSIHFLQTYSFLAILSGNSLKKKVCSFANLCLDRAFRFNHAFWSIQLKGLFLSSTPDPAFNSTLTSLFVSLPSLMRIFMDIMSLKVTLSLSKSPLLIYLYTFFVRVLVMCMTLSLIN